MKTKKISADEAQSSRRDQLRDSDRGSAVVKASKVPASWDKEARSARFCMSHASVDRYGDIIVTAGIDTTEFERNPVGLLFHNSRSWPVANWGNLEKILKGRPPRLEGDFILLPAGGPIPEIDQTEWMLANGGIRACSIGFLPDWKEVEMILDDEGKPTYGLMFNVSELIECSICAIPAAPGALAKMVADGHGQIAKELIEDILDNWAHTPEGLLVPRAEYEAAHRNIGNKPVTVLLGEAAAIAAGVERISGDGPAPEIFDDVHGCSLETVNLLARREVLYCTERTVDGKVFGGLIVAATWAAAGEVAVDRGLSEKVVGQVASVEKDAAGKIVLKSVLSKELTNEFLAKQVKPIMEVSPTIAENGDVYRTFAVPPDTAPIILEMAADRSVALVGEWPSHTTITMGALDIKELKHEGQQVFVTLTNGKAIYDILGWESLDTAVCKLRVGEIKPTGPTMPTAAEIAAVPLAERRNLLQRVRDAILGRAEVEPAVIVTVVEPAVVVEPPAPVAASADEVAAARAKAAAVRTRLVSKGLLAA